MPINDLASAGLRPLGSAKVAINSATTTNFDFGAGDLNLPALANYKHGDKILVVLSSTSSSATSTISFAVQDAPDNAGSIGTPAAAVTDGNLTGGTGDQYTHTFVRVQYGRPWLRLSVTNSGTNAHTAVARVFAVGPAV
ncbi:hypothetical protein BayCH28_22275 [Mycolicibacterium sp. CH28]|uniref:hypothetical protein n=1 Tax=Mycolicibacterium sp. CH28 TaxID=2512237 RepID=UPI00107FF779|nr:hypothetical protein [Mycolicibacterium sp. CH28]TGD85131.1 hypothetical protein BayCH28_22275 [Mycolicibacterium sp. CH28]